jgi:agmatinase
MNKNLKYNYQPLRRNFLGIEEKFSCFNNSKIVILPIPYEATTSYGKGASKGPEAIIKASHYVEFFDEETERELCFEKGICTLKAINFKEYTGKKAMNLIYNYVRNLIAENKFVVSLGGEHSISNPLVRAHFDKNDNFSILQLDAHSDLRNSYEGTKYSHACVAARIAEFTDNIVQMGIRAQSKEEFEFIKNKKIRIFYSYGMKHKLYGTDWKKQVIDSLKENVYITFDIDFLDPSIMPSTGTPEPDGFNWIETLDFMKKLSESRKIIGMDFVELSPNKRNYFPDFLTAKLIYKMLNIFL